MFTRSCCNYSHKLNYTAVSYIILPRRAPFLPPPGTTRPPLDPTSPILPSQFLAHVTGTCTHPVVSILPNTPPAPPRWVYDPLVFGVGLEARWENLQSGRVHLSPYRHDSSGLQSSGAPSSRFLLLVTTSTSPSPSSLSAPAGCGTEILIANAEPI